MSIEQKLANIQSKIHVKKAKWNSFGKYTYRSCDDILEAAKPLCREENVLLILSDSVVDIGNRFYVMATATLRDIENGEEIKNTAYAREEDAKKGTDACQLTGTASSYARKYALNGLFCLDDTADADATEKQIEEEARRKAKEEEERKEAEAKRKAKEEEEKKLKEQLQANGNARVRRMGNDIMLNVGQKKEKWISISEMDAGQLQWCAEVEEFASVRNELYDALKSSK